MSVIVRFTVPTETFTLGTVFRESPETTIELERTVPTTGAVVPSFWATGGDFERVETALERESAVERFRAVDSVESNGVAERTLYEVEWTQAARRFVREILDEEARLLEAHGSRDGWTFDLRFPSERTVEEFRRRCRERDVEFEVERFYTLAEWQSRSEFGLTDKQRETLLTALEQGYFDVPRGTSLDALGDQFGVSRQALSERLRRGQSQILRNAFFPE